jgi:hypothetical protein
MIHPLSEAGAQAQLDLICEVPSQQIMGSAALLPSPPIPFTPSGFTLAFA